MMITKNLFMCFSGIALVLISAVAGAAVSPTATIQIRSMMLEGEKMVNRGREGDLEMMVRHAEAMRDHAMNAVENLTEEDTKKIADHLLEAVGHLNELIDRGPESHGDILMAHAKKAMAHARRAEKTAESK